MEDPSLLACVYRQLAAAPGHSAFAPALDTAWRWLERLEHDFGAPVYSRLPHTVTHGDFTLANILFLGGRVSGVFDFDWARWAPRVRDLADGLFFISGQRRTPLVASDIWSLTEAVELSVPRVECWLDSYEAVSPLADRELACLPLALAARWLSVRVEGMAKVPEADRLRFALANLREPLDWLEAHWPEVRRPDRAPRWRS
jgi:Ser/Thr protein kinase RdoA (MazF antagonist)